MRRRVLKPRYCATCLRDVCIPECDSDELTDDEVRRLSLCRLTERPKSEDPSG